MFRRILTNRPPGAEHKLISMKYWFFTIHKTARRKEFTTEDVAPILNAHTAYFKELGRRGICIMAGPFVDQSTEIGAGFYILTAESEAEARKLADGDPFRIVGIYEYKMWEWTRVVPELE